MSSGVYKIFSILKELKVNFARNYSVVDDDYIPIIIFDFIIYKGDKVYLIQYCDQKSYMGSNLKSEQANDMLREVYCEKKDIPLLYVQYYNMSNIRADIVKFLQLHSI